MISILYHGHCPDGKFAAYAAWRVFGNAAQYYPVSYGDELPSELGDEIYLLDFSLKREKLLELESSRPGKIKVIDHHKSAQKDLAGLDFCVFDMEHSGAVLAWKYFHPDTEIPLLLQYVEDRDLWRWKLPNSKEINNVLLTFIYSDFELIGDLIADVKYKLEDYSDLVSAGEAIQKHVDLQLERSIRSVFYTEIAGHKIPTVNTNVYQSDLGNYMCEKFPDAPFCALYFDRQDLTQFSLRSIGEFDVSKIAEKYGGGGHKNAAGFEIKKQNVCILE